jgi:arginine/lysine/ornithine decarboxylase
MSLFASTSPSYLILQSLDLANRYLACGYRERLAAYVQKVAILKKQLTELGYSLVGDEPLKLTVDAKAYGYTGEELAKLLAEKGLICEFADTDYLVMMLTPESGEEALEQIKATLQTIKSRTSITERMPAMTKPVRAMSPREAIFSVGRERIIRECDGKVLAAATVSCPPAIPIVVCGEVIDGEAIRVMEYYGVKNCRVVES